MEKHFIIFVFLMANGKKKETKTICSSEMYEIYMQILQVDKNDWSDNTKQNVKQFKTDLILSEMEKNYNECISFSVKTSKNIKPYRWLDLIMSDCSKYHTNIEKGEKPENDFYNIDKIITSGYESLGVLIDNYVDWERIDIGFVEIGWCLQDDITEAEFIQLISKKESQSNYYKNKSKYSEYHKIHYSLF